MEMVELFERGGMVLTGFGGFISKVVSIEECSVLFLVAHLSVL